MHALLIVQLVVVGLLAGEEFVVRWGVQPAIAGLPDDAHVRTRIALVRSLKVVVPMVMVPAVLTSVAVLVVAPADPGRAWQVAAMASLVVFVLASVLGTVPINMGVDGWDPAAPPSDWEQVVTRWARIDVLRSTAAGVAFVLFTVALVVQVG